MGKYLTSLLILASSVLLPDEIFADEQVRRVQEELRKRHLFYADANGEKGAALTLALKRYQAKKGFPATGMIDFVTLASLGISTAIPIAATTPVAIVKRGQVHGANGETLPSDPPFIWPKQESVSKFDPAIIGRDYLDFELADSAWRGNPRRTLGRSLRLATLANERGRAFQVTPPAPGEESHLSAANPIWSALGLQPATEFSEEPGEIDRKRRPQAAVKSDRRSHRRSRRAAPRKEKNPFVLTYNSLDRAFRSWFSDSQTRKKRSTAKRL